MSLRHPSYAAQSCETVSVCIKGSFAAMQFSCSCVKKKKILSSWLQCKFCVESGYLSFVWQTSRGTQFRRNERGELLCLPASLRLMAEFPACHLVVSSILSPAGVRAPAGFRCRCPAIASRPQFPKEASQEWEVVEPNLWRFFNQKL